MRNCVVAVKRARGRVRFAPLFCSDSDDEAEAARNDGRKEGWREAPNMSEAHHTAVEHGRRTLLF